MRYLGIDLDANAIHRRSNRKWWSAIDDKNAHDDCMYPQKQDSERNIRLFLCLSLLDDASVDTYHRHDVAQGGDGGTKIKKLRPERPRGGTKITDEKKGGNGFL